MGSMFGNFLRSAGGIVAGTVRTASPILGKLPVIGTAVSAVGLGLSAYDLLSGGNKSPGQLPTLPGNPGGYGGGVPLNPNAGKRTVFGNDPNIMKALQGFAISKGNLKTFYRAPRGYVICHDEVGDAFALPKDLARKFYGWKPAKKPLLSIKDTNAIRHAGAAIKKLQKANKTAQHIANWHTPHAKTKVIQITGKRVK